MIGILKYLEGSIPKLQLTLKCTEIMLGGWMEGWLDS